MLKPHWAIFETHIFSILCFLYKKMFINPYVPQDLKNHCHLNSARDLSMFYAANINFQGFSEHRNKKVGLMFGCSKQEQIQLRNILTVHYQMLMYIIHSFGICSVKCHGVCTLWHYFSICFSAASPSDRQYYKCTLTVFLIFYLQRREIPLKMQKLWRKPQNRYCRSNFGSPLHSLRNKEMHYELLTALRSLKSKEATGPLKNMSQNDCTPLHRGFLFCASKQHLKSVRLTVLSLLEAKYDYTGLSLHTSLQDMYLRKNALQNNYIFEYCRTSERSVLGYHCIS